MVLTSFGNIGFRAITLLSKFILVFFLGKYSLNNSVLGEYGILVTTIAFLIYVLGFDFYTFNTREIISKKDNIISKVKDQLFFHSIMYLLILPITLFIVSYFGFIRQEYLLIFIFLSISEHLGQELFRLFTSLEKSLVANFLFFLKSGFWIWFVLIDFFILKNQIRLYKYLCIWTFFSWISLLLGVIIIKKNLNIKKWIFRKPNFKWIFKGIKTSSVFFLSSLSFLVIQLSDRFMIDFFFDKNLVGVYTMYAQFINAIDVFTFSGIIMVTYPKLIKNIPDKYKYRELFNRFFLKLVLTVSLLVACSFILAPHIFIYLNKPSFINFISTYNVLLLGVFFLVLSNAFHYDLYAKKKDMLLLKISLIAMCINVVLNLILIPRFSIFGASIATLCSFVFIFILKAYFSIIKKSI